MRRLRVLVVVAGLMSTGFATSAHAARARRCIMSGTLSFSSPLTLSPVTSGTLTFNYTANCYRIATPTGGLTTEAYTTSYTATYQGNCLLISYVTGVGVGAGGGTILGERVGVGVGAFPTAIGVSPIIFDDHAPCTGATSLRYANETIELQP